MNHFLIGLLLLVITILLLGCSWDLFGLDPHPNRYQQEKTCRDTVTGQFVDYELCK